MWYEWVAHGRFCMNSVFSLTTSWHREAYISKYPHVSKSLKSIDIEKGPIKFSRKTRPKISLVSHYSNEIFIQSLLIITIWKEIYAWNYFKTCYQSELTLIEVLGMIGALLPRFWISFFFPGEGVGYKYLARRAGRMQPIIAQ